jgi:heme oxygenase
MTTATTLQDELKQATAKSHQALEKKLIKVIKGVKSKPDYVKFLKLMYGYHAALEKELDRYLQYMQIGHRRTSQKLLNDINQLEQVEKVELCKDLPAIDSLASALGAMYVIEGSVMGAPHIAKMITSQVKLDGSNSVTFFDENPEELSANWQTFQTNLRREFEDDERRAIIRGATTTFETFSNWIDQRK